MMVNSLLIDGYATDEKAAENCEIWRPIPGFQGMYEASSLGRIRSAPMKTTSNARFRKRVWKTRVLKPKSVKNKKRADLRVSLWKDGVEFYFLVARLVASAFHGAQDNSMTVNHINGDWLDNRAENLEWVTRADNIRLGFESGLYSSITKPTALLSADGSRMNFYSMNEANRFLGRSCAYISNVLKKGKLFVTATDGTKYRVEVGE